MFLDHRVNNEEAANVQQTERGVPARPTQTEDVSMALVAFGHEEVLAAWNADRADVPSGHTAQFAAVLDALDAGQAPPVTLDDARITMEFIAALYASAFNGETIHTGQIATGSPFALGMRGTGALWEEMGMA